jgi:Zn-dependent protease with chaperone function
MPEVFLSVAAGVAVVVLAGSAFKIMQLSKGGGAVARSLGGRLVPPDTRDVHERKLLNVVEEMAIASGIAVPQVYVLDGETGINAFAAGFSPRDAAIGVTRGCIENLSRDQLQGVIAHEFSHIVNGDMRLNIRLMGVLFGILMLTVIGRVLLRTGFISGDGGGRSRGGKKQGGNPLPFIGLALIVIGYIGVFFANLIKSAISRQTGVSGRRRGRAIHPLSSMGLSRHCSRLIRPPGCPWPNACSRLCALCHPPSIPHSPRHLPR